MIRTLDNSPVENIKPDAEVWVWWVGKSLSWLSMPLKCLSNNPITIIVTEVSENFLNKPEPYKE